MEMEKDEERSVSRRNDASMAALCSKPSPTKGRVSGDFLPQQSIHA